MDQYSSVGSPDIVTRGRALKLQTEVWTLEIADVEFLQSLILHDTSPGGETMVLVVCN